MAMTPEQKRFLRARRKVEGDPIPRGTDAPRRFIAIDGEGRPGETFVDARGNECVRQPYYLMGASFEDAAKSRTLIAPEGARLTSIDCLNFITSLPEHSIIVGYGLGYDVTQILYDLPIETQRLLYHPEQRQATLPGGYSTARPVRYQNFWLNWQGKRFSVRKEGCSTGRTVWDVIKFFSGAAVDTFQTWIPDHADKDEEIAAIAAGKVRRGGTGPFDIELETRYCLLECEYLAWTMRLVREAAADVGIHLTTFYGAGSIATEMLKKEHVKDCIKDPPEFAKEAVDRAYFGGRFEISAHGPVHQEVHEYDINSAYPDAAKDLPCLTCGQWAEEAVGPKLDTASLALCYCTWDIKPTPRYGPFPVRTDEGLIYSPNGEGWYWLPEVRTAQKIFRRGIKVVRAITYRTACEHRPLNWIPEYYRKRQELGASGKGVILKLGLNSVYGKFAQRVGKPQYQCFTWAGMITAITRAKLLSVLAVTDHDNIIGFATDAVYSLTEIPIASAGKPLGGWEHKPQALGHFFARSGVLLPYDKHDKPKARGLSIKGLEAIREEAETIWNAKGINGKVAVKMNAFCGNLQALTMKDPRLRGSWYTRVVNLDFHPWPKRESYNATLVDGIMRSYPCHLRPEDAKGRAWTDDDARLSRERKAQALDQPDFVEAFA